jgi:hypothetical protein
MFKKVASRLADFALEQDSAGSSSHRTGTGSRVRSGHQVDARAIHALPNRQVSIKCYLVSSHNVLALSRRTVSDVVMVEVVLGELTVGADL